MGVGVRTGERDGETVLRVREGVGVRGSVTEGEGDGEVLQEKVGDLVRAGVGVGLQVPERVERVADGDGLGVSDSDAERATVSEGVRVVVRAGLAVMEGVGLRLPDEAEGVGALWLRVSEADERERVGVCEREGDAVADSVRPRVKEADCVGLRSREQVPVAVGDVLRLRLAVGVGTSVGLRVAVMEGLPLPDKVTLAVREREAEAVRVRDCEGSVAVREALPVVVVVGAALHEELGVGLPVLVKVVVRERMALTVGSEADAVPDGVSLGTDGVSEGESERETEGVEDWLNCGVMEREVAVGDWDGEQLRTREGLGVGVQVGVPGLSVAVCVGEAALEQELVWVGVAEEGETEEETLRLKDREGEGDRVVEGREALGLHEGLGLEVRLPVMEREAWVRENVLPLRLHDAVNVAVGRRDAELVRDGEGVAEEVRGGVRLHDRDVVGLQVAVELGLGLRDCDCDTVREGERLRVARPLRVGVLVRVAEERECVALRRDTEQVVVAVPLELKREVGVALRDGLKLPLCEPDPLVERVGEAQGLAVRVAEVDDVREGVDDGDWEHGLCD